ncbi:MAG: transporter [Kangiellaceae bacterium]|nr:transporter [Kangiellaceae bacterium]
MKSLPIKIKAGLVSFAIVGVAANCQQLNAATCSCAGVSLSDNINIADFEAEKFRLYVGYSYHDISRLVEKSRTIVDDTGRERTTETLGLTLNYGINKNWAITANINYVEHFRNISLNNSAGESSSGIGDTLIVLSYAPQKITPFEFNQFAFGVGLKIDTGKNDEGMPIPFAEDLQPGQGSNGYSFWAHYARSFSQKADWLFFIDGNFQSNEENSRGYSYEQELSIASGVSYSSDANWSARLALTWRKADAHTRASSTLPNTGGEWIDFSPSFSYALNEKHSLGGSVRIPLSRDLEGELQFTTKQLFSVYYAYQW